MSRLPLPIGHGDRVLLLVNGQLRGKHADVLGARPVCSTVRLDSGSGVLVLTKQLHPIPRRPRPDF